ncbi:leucine-rich repeat-containing protein 40 isoform X1 [Leptidea sinapis]|uniref:leucine-rich repeat-containing protein 40 isoform X1 n=1 Tax=Leptidea sinapis TaxID=189913 RepID=UPI00213924D9|nr:leucine-rich repeat-containing protein 40 isoform X1 [Leptidea sinapis]
MRPPSDYNDARMPAEAEEPDRRAPAMMICARLAGRAIIRVVGRCEDAQENSQLDLSECQLMQVPDAVYHLMRHTELKTCDLSGNVITKIPPKFTVKFSLITDLNLSNNQIAKLPDELCALTCLQRLDVSHNSFVALPHIACQCPSLHTLLAHHNQIIEVDVTRLSRSRALEYVDLSDNPIPPRTYEELQQITQPRISMSERQKEDWEEDLIL